MAMKTTNSLKGNPWRSSSNNDRRLNNTSGKGRSLRLKKGMNGRAQRSIRLKKF